MSNFSDQLSEPFDSLIQLEHDYLVNQNIEIFDELQSKRSEFMELLRTVWSDEIEKLAPPEVYKTWFQELFDRLVRGLENLPCLEAEASSLRSKGIGFIDVANEAVADAFETNWSFAVDAFSKLSSQLGYKIRPDRKTLRSNFTTGREFPASEFLPELLRAFGPTDQNLKATTNRLLPYYPMTQDVPEAMRENASKEPPTERDWSILLFALAEQAVMSWEMRPIWFDIRRDRRRDFRSRLFFDKFSDAIYSVSVVTPGFTVPSLPDSHEKLDKPVLLEIRASTAKQILMSQSDSQVSKIEEKLTINKRMLRLLEENPESRGWTVSQFTQELKCSRGGVHKTHTWQALISARKLGRVEKTKDRHHNGR